MTYTIYCSLAILKYLCCGLVTITKLFGKATLRRRIARAACNPAPDSELRRHLQIEIVFQFFIGYFDDNGAYVDDIFSVVTRYGLSINSFGFDFITSLPWSFLDYWAYQASATCTLFFCFFSDFVSHLGKESIISFICSHSNLDYFNLISCTL
jgi:hypothetical protein